jgi:hypothetical protein
VKICSRAISCQVLLCSHYQEIHFNRAKEGGKRLLAAGETRRSCRLTFLIYVKGSWRVHKSKLRRICRAGDEGELPPSQMSNAQMGNFITPSPFYSQSTHTHTILCNSKRMKTSKACAKRANLISRAENLSPSNFSNEDFHAQSKYLHKKTETD